jgi:hypothetical protein
MTRYEKLNLVFTGTGVAVGIGVLVIYSFQLKAMREATRAAEKSANAAVDAVKVARDTWKSSNESFTATLGKMDQQVKAMQDAARAGRENAAASNKSAGTAQQALEISHRADLFFHPTIPPHFEYGKVPKIEIAIINTGHITATVFELGSGYFVGFESELPGPDQFRTDTSQENYRISPGDAGIRGTLKTFKLENFPTTVPKGAIELIQNGKAHFWFYIKCRYRDHFGTHRSCRLFKYEDGKLLTDSSVTGYECAD